MKIPMLLLVFVLPVCLIADDDISRDETTIGKPDQHIPDPLINRALARLEKKMGILFQIPFPKEFDIDAYQKRPIAWITIQGSKICATRPIVNPYDEPRKVEWLIGPEDPKKLLDQGFDCSFDLDERGDFFRWSLVADWAKDETGNHQIWKSKDETHRDFSERAHLTYLARSAKAKDPAMAKQLLAGFEEIAATIQALRKEETGEPATIKHP
jgi:hypothetical protein